MEPLESAELTYDQTGVRYDLIDPLKVQAQRAAAATAVQLAQHGMQEVKASRGESAYLIDAGPFLIASIVECLGSKALVADEMYRLTGTCRYDAIAQDTLAMAVNDLVTVGATPLVVQAYWAAGGSAWFADAVRAQALVQGWQQACERCGVAWGGGETPALAGVVEADRVDLAAGCTGIVSPKDRLSLGDRLGENDAIVLLASSGIHANGLSLARELARRLPQGYLTEVAHGLSYGDALLEPTVLYPPVIRALHEAGIVPHYAANITGHGWRKLMRHPGAWIYHLDVLPEVPEVLRFICRHAGLSDEEAYGTFNMGAGFALFVHPDQADAVVQLSAVCGVPALVAGRIEPGPKRVCIHPLNLSFDADSLQLR